MDTATGGPVRLRDLGPDDLPWLFQMQLDPESNLLAGTIPRSAETFATAWAKALHDPNATAKVILLDGVPVGTVSRFPRDGLDFVGYWIDRGHWGKGIASRALELLLREVAARPLYAHVATGNGASLRVLQKCGFVVERVRIWPASERYLAGEAAELVLAE